MNDYEEFLETKKRTVIQSGFEIDESKLNPAFNTDKARR